MNSLHFEIQHTYHVAVSQRRHRHDGVPESSRNRCEIGSIDILLGVKHHSSEDDDGHGEREDQEA